jgi:superfamily II DNA or RNA helicase
MQELFEEIRGACAASAWSRGVELVRAGAVSAEPETDGEIPLRIVTRGGLVSRRVILSPAIGGWECNCGSREEVCEHVAAAAIAMRRSASDDAGPAVAAAAGRIGYRLSRDGSGLALERVIVNAQGEHLLTTTLAAVAEGRAPGPSFAATQADLAVERALGPRLRGSLPRGLLLSLLPRLAECPDLRLDGESVRASTRPVGLVARVDDAEPGFRVTLGSDASVEETFEDALALAAGELRPLAASQLTGRELEQLSRGRVFGAGEAALLVTELLPALSGRVAVEIRTQRLPSAVRETPRLRFVVSREADALCVLPTLVYGDPPIARVDAGRLVALGPKVPLRDEAVEQELTRRLSRELGLAPGFRERLTGERAIAVAQRLPGFGAELRGDAHRAFHRAPALVPSLSVRDAGFDLAFETQVDGSARRADPAAVLRAWRDGETLVPLQGGGLAPLPQDWLERLGHRIADLLAARGRDGSLPRCALPDLARLCDALGEPPPTAALELRAALEDFAGIPKAELPPDLTATLRGYQRQGVDWLCWLRDAGLGALLADDMGLGKTLQALCALRGRTLVVAPTSVLHNWEAEIARFRPALRVSLYHGPRRAVDPEADVTVTSYALLRLDAEVLQVIAWDSAVLDEAQAIKNPESQVARAAHALQAKFRVALTGTPVENRLDELWSQLHFANPGLLGSRRDFDERTARPIAAGDADAAARLRERIRPFLLRRAKREVAPELPPRTDMVVHAVLSPDERATYDAVLAATRRDVAEKLAAGGGALAALEALLRLRQAACHPALLPSQARSARSEAPRGEPSREPSEGEHPFGPARSARSGPELLWSSAQASEGTQSGSAKLDVLLELVEEIVAEGHKALVFSQWTSLLDLVEPPLHAAGIDFTRLDGSTRDRGAVVARFQDAAGPPLLLVSLTAGGLGLNLTAADHVVILDPWWNPAVEDQAASRAHRIGQERPVMVYRIVAEDTVEERVLALQRRKQELARVALGGAGAAASLTREDLLALLD